MCGIVGKINFNNKEVEEKTLTQMMEKIKHRGPDDNGYFIDEGVGLGFVRLSVIDLSSAGHQPMISDDDKLVLIYNGEIYNYLELREELKNKGHTFKSNTDTEVILKSYEEWGEACLNKFNGMWAFVIYNKETKEIFGARDRFGVKPFYYCKNEESFLFASEIKSFHQHPKFVKSINYNILPYYFQFGYIPAPGTIFNRCHKLQAGHYLTYNLTTKETTLHNYWNVKSFYQKETFNKSESEILKDIESILEDSLRLRMISDVPVGIFLSGGYDSSLVSALLQKKLNDIKRIYLQNSKSRITFTYRRFF